RVTITRFAGKTKKGEIRLVGSSRWPNFNFTLQAHELSLRPEKYTRAIANADLQLRGNASAPIISGRIELLEGVYTLPPKEKTSKDQEKTETKSKKAPLWLETTLDVAAQWRGNVWYRDGVTSIETRGDLRIQKDKGQAPLRLVGTISSVRGSYNYYGRDFMIE